MRIQVNMTQQNGFFPAYRINQSVYSKMQGENGMAESVQRDRVMISPQGRKNRMMDMLMRQKADILERKESLINSVKKEGSSMEAVKSQLESLDEQLDGIERQLAEAMAKEMEKQTDKMKDNGASRPKTKEEAQNQRLADITKLSGSLKQAETVDSVKARMDGDARVLKSEIELDRMHQEGMQDVSNKAIARKEAELAKMHESSVKLAASLGEMLGEMTEEAKAVGEADSSKRAEHVSEAENDEKAETA